MTDQAPSQDARYRSRKFLITCSALLLASVFLAFGKITGAEWTQIALMCLGAYNLANAISGGLRGTQARRP
ncbi:MAG: hypothetical protein AAGI72_15435 [Pseudomonadota bacterium]